MVTVIKGEDQVFKVILSYISSSKPGCATGALVLKGRRADSRYRPLS